MLVISALLYAMFYKKAKAGIKFSPIGIFYPVLSGPAVVDNLQLLSTISH
jgi:hypothetical protein